MVRGGQVDLKAVGNLLVGLSFGAESRDLRHRFGDACASEVEAVCGVEHRADLMGLEHGTAWAVVAQAAHPAGGVVVQIAAFDGIVEDARQQRQALVDRLVRQRPQRIVVRVALDIAGVDALGDATSAAPS